MTSTLLLQRRTRRIVPIAIIVVGLILISVLVIQQVSAQEARTLKTPVKLIQSDRAAQQPAGILPPLDAPIVMSQIFNSSYQPVTDPTLLGWHEVIGLDATVGYTWKYAGTRPFTDTVWAAGRNPSGYPQLSPATDTYTNGMEAVLAYGPLDMSDYGQAVFTMTYWLDTAPGDSVGVAVSTDGSNFEYVNNQSVSDPTLATRRTVTLNLSPYIARQPAVWIAIYLKSDAKLPNGRGMFVHDVVVRGVPLSRAYLPLMMHGYPPATNTPTPTATPSAVTRYSYTFGSGGPNNSDFQTWGGENTTATTCDGSACAYNQNIVTLGNPGGAVTLYSYDLHLVGGSGPRVNNTSLSMARNFEYSADFYVYTGQKNARYGLVFNATASTFPGDNDPPFAPEYNYYLLEMRMDSDTRTKVATWQLLKIVDGTRNSVTSAVAIPVSITEDQWHNLKVRQEGSTLSFYLNGSLVGTATYENWNDGRRHFGTFIDIRGSNNEDDEPFEVFFDNVTVVDLP